MILGPISNQRKFGFNNSALELYVDRYTKTKLVNKSKMWPLSFNCAWLIILWMPLFGLFEGGVVLILKFQWRQPFSRNQRWKKKCHSSITWMNLIKQLLQFLLKRNFELVSKEVLNFGINSNYCLLFCYNLTWMAV